MAKKAQVTESANEPQAEAEAPAPAKAAKKPSETFKKYAAKYGATGHCGDEIAATFKSYVTVDGKCSPDKLKEVADANGIDLGKWSHVNIGMQRMNLGNAMRGLHNKGKAVVIGDTEIPGAEAKPEKEAA